MGGPLPRVQNGSKSIKERVLDELHAPARKNFDRQHVILKGLNDLYQADLIEMRTYAKENDNFNYILVVINCFSKKCFLEPLKNKTGIVVAKALGKILKKIKPPFKNFQTDMGGEFKNVHVSKLLKQYNIHHYTTFSTLKASIAERLNRTIKSFLFKAMSVQGSYRWLDILHDIETMYNQRVHRTIGMAPINVSKKNEVEILARFKNMQLPPKTEVEIRVGDPVRISKHKGIFDKSYYFNWTPEIFIVDKVEHSRPATFSLRDIYGEKILGKFYREEIKKTNYPDVYLVEKVLQRKPGYAYVKYLGFDDKFNEWIKSKNVI